MSAAAPAGSAGMTGGRFGLASPRSARVFAGVTFVLLVANLPLVALAHQFTFANIGLGLLLGLPYAVVGTVVA
jgi:hypothetical protein